MTIRCYGCGGEAVRRQVNLKLWWGDTYIVVRDVTAWVCIECGEMYFDAQTCLYLDGIREGKSGGHGHAPARARA